MISNHKIYAVPYQILFQEAYSPSMEGIINFHHDIMVWLIIITIFIFWIMCQMIYRFSSFKNSYPEELDHNVSLWLEILWTILPVFILISISIPSFSLLYSLDEVIDCVLTIKVTGAQWYWEYEYPEMDIQNISNDPFIFQSYMIQEEDLAFGELRLLEVDRRVVIPSNHHVRFIVTSSDVIHSWAIPSLGVKMDACPGRLNQVHLFCNQPGIYYGQCSEICGVNHGFMPIVVEAVTMDDFLTWYSKSSVEDLGLADSYLKLNESSRDKDFDILFDDSITDEDFNILFDDDDSITDEDFDILFDFNNGNDNNNNYNYNDNDRDDDNELFGGYNPSDSHDVHVLDTNSASTITISASTSSESVSNDHSISYPIENNSNFETKAEEEDLGLVLLFSEKEKEEEDLGLVLLFSEKEKEEEDLGLVLLFSEEESNNSPAIIDNSNLSRSEEKNNEVPTIINSDLSSSEKKSNDSLVVIANSDLPNPPSSSNE